MIVFFLFLANIAQKGLWMGMKVLSAENALNFGQHKCNKVQELSDFTFITCDDSAFLKMKDF
jgi:hypothetical protein